MIRVVQKFGGTSVATLERIKNVADIIARSHKSGQNTVAVVSAMAGVTNKFIGYVRNLDAYEGDPEYDRVVSSGELITAGLLAIALKNLGLNARSYSSWQVPIFTDGNYGHAVIKNIDPSNLNDDIANGIIPVVCGFQGINPENRITTLGRGGSDFTAVAIASSIGADLCEIYSDVDGVYTVDPNLYQDAKRIDGINYHEMLEMASQGAKILQEQSVDYAMKKDVVIRVASSFVEGKGTIISGKILPKNFRGLAVTPSLSQIRISHNASDNDVLDVLERHFIKAEIFKKIENEKTDILLDKKKTAVAVHVLKNCDFVRSVRQIIVRKQFSQISVIGSLMTTETCKMLTDALISDRIETFGFSVANYKVNLIVSSDKLLESIAVLHRYCGLEK
ncbi:MAG: aspartate kinase [Holosporaceae bacterium]|nr:aspartate kinase [Holosporaceae bacterium]